MVNIDELAKSLVQDGMRKPENIDKETSHTLETDIGELTFRYNRETDYFDLTISLADIPIGYFQFKKPSIGISTDSSISNEHTRVFGSNACDIGTTEYLTGLGFTLPDENMALYVLSSQRGNRVGSLLFQLGLAVLVEEGNKFKAASGLPVHMHLQIADENILPFYESMGITAKEDSRPTIRGSDKTWSADIYIPPYQIRSLELKS